MLTSVVKSLVEEHREEEILFIAEYTQDTGLFKSELLKVHLNSLSQISLSPGYEPESVMLRACTCSW